MWGRVASAVLILIAITSVATAIEADTHIRLDPHPDVIGYYNNSTYIICNYTNQESANVTIKFERFNETDNSTDIITDFGEFAVNTTDQFNISTANFSAVGRYRAAMYAHDGSGLCSFWIAVRDNTSTNYEQLHGSVRFADADSVPSVSFVEPISGRGTAWTTDSISLTHSLELYTFGDGWSPAAGGNLTLTDYTNTSGNETNWVLAANYSLGQSYMLLIYSHDYELLDMHLVVAVVPTSNVVELEVRDVETNERIMAFTGNMMDIPKTATSGEVVWTNVTNGEHLITVTADGYATGTTTIYMANSYINTTVYLLRQSPYYTPHWVRFHLTNILMQPYADVNVSVAYVSAGGENITLTGITGTDGAVAFLLTPTFRHTITFTNASQGIDKTIHLYPKDQEYWIIAKATEGGWADYEHDPTRYIHITVSQHEINDTHAFINVTYLDDLNMTTALSMWINQTNASDLLGDQIMIDSWDSPGSNNSTSHSFIVQDYRGQDYMAYVWHEHDEFGTIYTRAVRFIGILIDLGLSTTNYAYMSFAILFFMAAMFGATSTSIGGIVTCVTGWLLYAIGWLGILGLTAPICLALASTYAVGVMLADRARKGGYA